MKLPKTRLNEYYRFKDPFVADPMGRVAAAQSVCEDFVGPKLQACPTMREMEQRHVPRAEYKVNIRRRACVSQVRLLKSPNFRCSSHAKPHAAHSIAESQSRTDLESRNPDRTNLYLQRDPQAHPQTSMLLDTAQACFSGTSLKRCLFSGLVASSDSMKRPEGTGTSLPGLLTDPTCELAARLWAGSCLAHPNSQPILLDAIYEAKERSMYGGPIPEHSRGGGSVALGRGPASGRTGPRSRSE